MRGSRARGGSALALAACGLVLVFAAGVARAEDAPPSGGADVGAVASDSPAASGPTPVGPAESVLSEYATGAAPNPKPPRYTLLRFNESYAYLADPARSDDPFDVVKHISLGSSDPYTYLSLGGEVRERFEHFDNFNFGIRRPIHQDYLLQRITLHADLHLTERFRFFVQGISGLQLGGERAPLPVNEDTADLQQGFFDVVLGDPTDRDPRLTIRGGRFEMTYGSGRMVATRAAPNIPFKFDGGQLIGAWGTAKVYSFLVVPGRESKYDFDEENRNQLFWGVYGQKGLEVLESRVDAYYLGFRDRQAKYAGKTGIEDRHTVGARYAGKTSGFDWDWESMFQFGSFHRRDILAWQLATDTGFTFTTPLSPRLGVKVDAASGTTGRGKGTLETFNSLYFKAGYFNEASVTRASNLVDIRPTLRLLPSEDVLLLFGSSVNWRYSTRDAYYAPPGFVLLPANVGPRYVGETAEASVEWQAQRHVAVTACYVHYFTHTYVADAHGGPVDFMGAWVTFTW